MCYRTGKYAACRRVRASFSTEILQAWTVKGLIQKLGLRKGLWKIRQGDYYKSESIGDKTTQQLWEIRHVGITQWLERRTRDRRVQGSNPGRSSGRIVFSWVSFLCWLKFRYPFHPCVTAVSRKSSWSFCQKCRWQVTAKHIYTLPMCLWMKSHCKLVHGWMVYTELAPRRQQFVMWHQPCNNQRALLIHHFCGYQ